MIFQPTFEEVTFVVVRNCFKGLFLGTPGIINVFLGQSNLVGLDGSPEKMDLFMMLFSVMLVPVLQNVWHLSDLFYLRESGFFGELPNGCFPQGLVVLNMSLGKPPMSLRIFQQ
jgi:hypothetical protein